ncbi:MAG TPA: nuclear transport factor 2 family protein [Gemmatimonadales bacterium]|nr:nuclear transport factor 2 family protein [Gemmatimonadales bacterium]
MPSSTDIVAEFYTAFARRDHAAMARCYTVDATFSDPVFTDLRGNEVRTMWRMLCERGQDLRIVFRDIHAQEDGATARWEAWYTFTGTGRSVHNVIDAEFTFRNGLIVHHTDRFDLYRWARQALGPMGALLGWSSPMQRVIRRNALAALTKYSRPAAP